MSERSFQNTFRELVGLSAKEFARILRLQATIRRLDDGSRSMAELAIESGFADQAHATREVRRVTGTTPAKLRDALRRDRDGDSSVRLAAAFVRGRIG
jgi:AraC-like DNA-binding protein